MLGTGGLEGIPALGAGIAGVIEPAEPAAVMPAGAGCAAPLAPALDALWMAVGVDSPQLSMNKQTEPTPNQLPSDGVT